MKKFYIILLIVAVCLQDGVLSRRVRTEKDIADQMIKYARKTQSQNDIIEFRQIIAFLMFSNYLYRSALVNFNDPRASVTCLTCRSAVSAVVSLHKNGASTEVLAEYIINLCIMLNIESPAVCRGAVTINLPVVEYILDNTPEFSSKSFCGVLLQSSNNNCPYSDPRYEWTIDIPDKITQLKTPVVNNEEGSFKFVHLTDVHYDPAYEYGGLANCNEPTCCRKGQKEKGSRRENRALEEDTEDNKNVYMDEEGVMFIDLDQVKNKGSSKRTPRQEEIEDEEPAGYWGDYRDCDVPWWTFVDSMERINEHKNIDYIYYTGDTIDHGVWETSKPMITQSVNDTCNQFKETFGNKPVFPTVGNHEAHPINQYAPPYITDPEVSTAWLYELLYQKWSAWLPQDTKSTILTGGYYTTLIKPGLRIVVLNSNLCYVFNWWIHHDPRDPSGQLKWLVDTLYKAEKAGERVHLLSHVPSSELDVYYTCSREYVKIIRRFAHIIVAEFNGHTHNDEFKVYYDKDNNTPLLMAWNSGSLTPFSFLNPNYRIFEVDKSTYNLIDFDTYSYNLTEANLTPNIRPKWSKLYSFKEHYGVKSIDAAAIDNLIQRMVTTDKKLLQNDYHGFRGKNSDTFLNTYCDEGCVKQYLCYMVRMDIYDTQKCDHLSKSFNESKP